MEILFFYAILFLQYKSIQCTSCRDVINPASYKDCSIYSKSPESEKNIFGNDNLDYWLEIIRKILNLEKAK
jgi:hypothetical protein